MSLISADEPRQKITVASLREKKLLHQPITCLTAYDYSSARLVDEAAIDIVLVGDSLAQAILGHENTLSVTIEEMLHHTRAARRGVKHALLVGDMPFGSYQADPAEAIRNAARFVKEAGAEVVKVEGGEKRADLIRRIIDAEIPVAAHHVDRLRSQPDVRHDRYPGRHECLDLGRYPLTALELDRLCAALLHEPRRRLEGLLR